MWSSDEYRGLNLSRARRMVCAVFLCLPMALWVSSCGYHLRNQVNYPFRSLYIDGNAAPLLTQNLKFMLASVEGLTLADNPKSAEVILQLTDHATSKEILSLSSAGRAREYALKQRLSFRLYDADNIDWMPSDHIVIERTFLYDDSERLAREIQENDIYEEMLRDMAQQILRRLQSAKKPA
jgi:LPS-assembly lipoprotein